MRVSVRGTCLGGELLRIGVEQCSPSLELVLADLALLAVERLDLVRQVELDGGVETKLSLDVGNL